MKNLNIVVTLPKGFDREKATEDEYKKYSVYETFDIIESDDRLKIGDDIYWCWSKKEFPLSINTYYLADRFQFKEAGYLIEDEITCPYCGYVYGDSWEDAEEDDARECEICGSVFSYTKVITVDYRSSPVEKNGNIREVK